MARRILTTSSFSLLSRRILTSCTIHICLRLLGRLRGRVLGESVGKEERDGEGDLR